MIASLNKIRISHEKSPDPKFNVLFEQFPGGFNSKMTENEALLILGITEDEIMHLDTQLLKKKHRKCMIQNHPDKGGSPYMAMKINQAKEILDASYMVRR
ncbi:unnamed protein product [Kuraishia capsulata CBS 1993]|uniref:J domain-containing protein n=1 Tax=Kuraishia capsulata CBS 1993 TaxID=1382522 RepID=W6MW88_9ASCO|nr:uncharacterized protein KUCA_T00002997001 [Kuraishia capsulata CBS 1993]CDK27020.1 unnamed protein product [Kuraishia capsulata CBS 1993]